MSERVQEPLHERWRDYSNKEIVAIKRTKCIVCPYRGVVSTQYGDITRIYCNYLEMTGQARLIRPELCEHYLESDDIRQSHMHRYSSRGVMSAHE